MSTSATLSAADLIALLDSVPLSTVPRFQRRIAKARSRTAREAIAHDIAEAAQRVEKIRAALPEVRYPDDLPVSEHREEIRSAIATHQVVIIAGETGSGKTTQIPKMCLELGRGLRGRIGHTQPRRLAARTVAERIATELGQEIGETVGYAIRFDDKVNATTAVKLMTDGILLAEMQHDRDLRAYDTIIIDEAHERSLNIDFLLGYLKQLLPRRPDLKVIITSATIDPERFAHHFSSPDGTPAPIIEVSGRTYPVEVRYRPLEREVNGTAMTIDPIDGLLDAVREVMSLGDGDVLCFFPSERDIRDAMEAMEKQHWRNVEITPLFGRLSNSEQHRVFRPHSGRRIVLATNIAETSLTVPGIHYVVDTGTARISRYSTRTKVQRLPIEPISQASANQRSGRCGRIAAGVAIRLYSEEDYLSRPEYTDPEILRTNLASVILHMAVLKLGDIEAFPFVEAPDHKAIRDGMVLLHELGAITQRERDGLPELTGIGRQIARIPLDPRLARMLVEAQRLGCLNRTIIVAAALTVQDLRERPLDKQAQADQLHARFRNKNSDFLSRLSLWDYLELERRQRTGNGFRRMMREEFLHYMRWREWRDLVRQLRDICSQLGWRSALSEANSSAEHDADSLHQSLLSGLLSNIGSKKAKGREYQGARNTTFMIFPGSGVAKKQPDFLMAAELVETSQLWGRDVAAIDPSWVEKLAPTLVRHTFFEPFWSAKRGAAMVHEKVSLYGVTLVSDRTVPYHRADATAAREMFIRHALVMGEWNVQHPFLQTNNAKLSEASQVEEKTRRRGLVLDEDALVDFYQQRIPKTITTGAHFNSWWKKIRQKNPHLLDFDATKLLSIDASTITDESFPDIWRDSDTEFALRYRFEPGTPDDGVTVRIPVPMLASLRPEPFEWLVPGLHEELLTELIRTLPKGLRRSVVPAPEFAARALPLAVAYRAHHRECTVREGLAQALRSLGAHGISPDDFSLLKLPPHLCMNFAAIDKRGEVIDVDKSLPALQNRQAGKIASSMAKLAGSGQEKRAARWSADTLGTIPEVTTTRVDGHEVKAYPALVATRTGVALRTFATRREADQAMLTAQLTLLLRTLTVPTKQMLRGFPLTQRVALDNYPHGSAEDLVEEARVAALRDRLVSYGALKRDPDAFAEQSREIARHLPGDVRRTVVMLAPALVLYHRVSNELELWEGPAIDDMRAQLEFLLPERAVAVYGPRRLQHVARYLQAMLIRLEDMDADPDRDAARQDGIESLKEQLAHKLAGRGASAWRTQAVRDVQWDIEELRVSVFAQRLGTAHSVSARRIEKAIAALR